jgi:TetR/AcrR family transcriptional regulator, regulator of cefoperazone and chloramphenicol sensitivity
MKTKPEPKKRRGQEDTKARLLEAALDIFAKEGYDAATTRNIAKKAGVNESLIQRYFKSKLGLFFQLRKQAREKFLSELLAYDESSSLEEELIKFMKKKLQRTGRDKKFFKMAIARSILDSKMRDDVQRMAEFTPPHLIERFERFRAKGMIRTDVDLKQVIDIVLSLAFTFSLMTDAIECVEIDDANRLIETVSKVLTDGLNPKRRESS